VRRAKAAFSGECESHSAILHQPEAVGAAMEVTKWLKPYMAPPVCQVYFGEASQLQPYIRLVDGVYSRGFYGMRSIPAKTGETMVRTRSFPR